jgi:hypothetical protein
MDRSLAHSLSSSIPSPPISYAMHHRQFSTQRKIHPVGRIVESKHCDGKASFRRSSHGGLIRPLRGLLTYLDHPLAHGCLIQFHLPISCYAPQVVFHQIYPVSNMVGNCEGFVGKAPIDTSLDFSTLHPPQTLKHMLMLRDESIPRS